MGNLTKLQVHMLRMLINEPLKAFKLRNKYTQAFDQMFKYAFGTSFGVEIEINPNFFKNKDKSYLYFIRTEEGPFRTKINRIERKYSGGVFGTRNYTDGDCQEYTFPVRSQNLHIIYKYLKQIRRSLKCEIGTGSFDTSSSMHLHISIVNVGTKYLDTSVPLYLEYLNKMVKNDHIKHVLRRSGCSILNRALVIRDFYDPEQGSCYLCDGCNIDMSSLRKKTPEVLKQHLLGGFNHVYTSPKRNTVKASRVPHLLSPLPKMLFLLKDGFENAEKVYYSAFRLFDLKYRDKLQFILGQFDEEYAEILLNHMIVYLIPYMSMHERRSSKYTASQKSFIRVNSDYHSHEIRIFAGSTNFSTIMKRALLFNSIYRLSTTHDSTLLDLFLDII